MADATITIVDGSAQVDVSGVQMLAPLLASVAASAQEARQSELNADASAVAAAGAVPGAASSAVKIAAQAAVDNRRNKVLLSNLARGYVDPAGNFQQANDWRTFTASVTPGGVITTNMLVPNNTGLKFLRGDESVAQVIVGTGANSDGTMVLTGAQIPVPAGAVAMQASGLAYRFASDGSNDQILFPHLVVLEGTVALPGRFSDALLYDGTRSARDNQWVGRRVGVTGDSFWSGRRWYLDLQADLGFELVNFSQGGRTMDRALRDANGNPLTQASVTGLDALIYSIHTNSAAANLPVGDPGDAPAVFDANANMTGGATAFSQAVGGLNVLTGWNKEMLPMIGSPIYRPGVALIPDYQALMPTLAQMFGGVVIEPDLKCGVNAITASEKLVDNVHPTEPGFQSWYRSAFRDAFLRNSPLT